MEFRHLQQIAAVCRHGGFSAAARHLRISQPTLSKSIARMEDRLAVQLFERDSGAARPTVYGEFLAERATALVRSLETLASEFDQFKHGRSGQLRIGMGPLCRDRLMAPLLARMGESLPDLNLRTGVAAGDQISRAVADGEYDLGFVYSESANAFGELVRAKVFDDRYIAAVRPGHPALGRNPLGPAELLTYKVAACAIVPSFRRWLGPLSREQSENLRGLVTDIYDVIASRVARSDFVGVAPSFAFRDRIAEGSLVELPLTWEGAYECWMVATQETWKSPIVRQVLAFAREIAASGPRLAPDLADGVAYEPRHILAAE